MSRTKVSEYVKNAGLEPDEVPKLFLPYQRKWLADTSSVKLHTKSRRIGISWTEAADRVLCGAQTNGHNSFYISYEKDMTRQFIEDAADWSKAFQFACSEIEEDVEIFRDGDEDKSVQVFRIYFNSGYKIEALSGNPRNPRSREGCFVIDEAAFVDELMVLLKAARGALIWGSSIHLITTYNGVDNDYYDLEQDVIAGKLPYSRHFTTFTDAVIQGLYKRICIRRGERWTAKKEAEWVERVRAEIGEDDAAEELDCVPSQSGGCYFSRLLIKQAMEPGIPVLKLSFRDEFALRPEPERRQEVQEWLREILEPHLELLEPNLKTSYGKDFARDVDLSYLIVGQEQPNLVRRAAFALEMSKVPFSQQLQILFFIADRLPRFVGGAHDARGNGQNEAEAAADKYGHDRITQVQFTDKWYGENFPKYKAGLEDRQVVLPLDSDLLDDHRQVVRVKGIPKLSEKRKKDSKGSMRHGDGAIACCLWWFASESDFGDAMPAQASEEFECW